MNPSAAVRRTRRAFRYRISKEAHNQARLTDALFDRERREFEGIEVSDLSEIPGQYCGLVLHVNDHGNVSLYRCFKRGSLHEIASRV